MRGSNRHAKRVNIIARGKFSTIKGMIAKIIIKTPSFSVKLLYVLEYIPTTGTICIIAMTVHW